MSELLRNWAANVALQRRLAVTADWIGTTIISIEELLRGQLAQIARAKDNDRLIVTYSRAQKAISGLARWPILPSDAAVASIFDQLRKQRGMIGTMDLRITRIVLAQGGTLLSRNGRDFGRVPNLKLEDWTA